MIFRRLIYGSLINSIGRPFKFFTFATGLLYFSPMVLAKTNVVTTTTELAWAAENIGGDRVKIESLLSGTENAHYVDAVPNFIRLIAAADIVCAVGLDLEIGWLPKALSKSGNRQVQKGGKGYCELGSEINALEKPKGSIDRSMGHIHPSGKAFGAFQR